MNGWFQEWTKEFIFKITEPIPDIGLIPGMTKAAEEQTRSQPLF